MVVCKFFQQGSCRYGQNCRFEHTYASKYSYHAPTQTSATQSQSTAVSDEQLVNQVHSDVQAALQGGQWILSCFSPFKEKPILPGLIDLSPEEARLFIYEAKANNTLDQAVAYLTNLFIENRTKYQQLLQPNAEIKCILRKLYSGESVSSPFSNQVNSAFGVANNNASSIFQNAVQTSPFAAQSPQGNSIFGSPNKDPAQSIFAQATQNVFSNNQNQSPGIFATNQQAQQTQSIFNTSPQQSNVFGTQIPNPNAKSIFSQASQNTFGQSPPQSQPQSIFANAAQQTFGQNQNMPLNQNDPFGQKPSDPFGQNTSDPFSQKPSDPFGQKPSDPFGQKPSDPFGQKPSDPFGQKPSDPFGQKPSDPFGQKPSDPFASQGFGSQRPGASIFEQPIDETGIYSKIEAISEADLSSFNDQTFKLGFVPEIAPPLSLCT